jgi:hypothetical protein
MHFGEKSWGELWSQTPKTLFLELCGI